MKTVLGFDFGMKKMGVAIGQTVTQTATPLIILKAMDGVPDWAEIEKLKNKDKDTINKGTRIQTNYKCLIIKHFFNQDTNRFCFFDI